jgi:hypothetical protein
MPFYIYKVQQNPILQVSKLEEHEAFRDASARAKDLRREIAFADGGMVKVIFAGNELEAEDLLSQVREPQPELGDD